MADDTKRDQAADDKRTETPRMTTAQAREWRRHLDESAAWQDLTADLTLRYTDDGLRLSGGDIATTRRAMLLAQTVLEAHGYRPTAVNMSRRGDAVVRPPL